MTTYTLSISPYGESIERTFPTREEANELIEFVSNLEGQYLTSWGYQDIDTSYVLTVVEDSPAVEFKDSTKSVASELEAVGIDIYVATSQLSRRNIDWFQFRKNGNIGYYDGSSFDHSWSMPIKPSREHGSGMFVDAAEDADTNVEAALIILADTNRNDIVGTHSNFTGRHDIGGYTRVLVNRA